jgi:hypothetical protein
MVWPSLVEHWGSTPSERAEFFPCDELIAAPDHVMFRARGRRCPTAVEFEPGPSMMMRRQLLNLKGLAEHTTASDEPLHRHA